MNRRQFLASGTLCLSLPVAGCLDGIDQTNEAQGDGESPTNDEEDPSLERDATPPSDPGGPVLAAWWVERAPDGTDVYPSDEPPVSDYDMLLTLFNAAIEREPAGETDHGVQHGEGVYDYPSEETYEKLSTALKEVETPDGDPYHFFEHDDTIVRLLMTVDD